MILIIDHRLDGAATVASMLRFMGVLSCITTPAEAPSKISNKYKAVIVSSPEKTYITYELIKTIRVYSLNSPIFAICEDENEFRRTCPDKAVFFDKIFSTHTRSSTLLSRINEYIEDRGLAPIGDYRLAGIDASASLSSPTLFDTELKLTKTELMILRYLIVSFPTHVSAKRIIENCFKRGRFPELSSVRTHISAINKKFLALTGRYWITSEPSIGYRIVTPTLIASTQNTN